MIRTAAAIVALASSAYADPLVDEARAQQKQKHASAALTTLERATTQDPKSFDAWSELAVTQLKLGKSADARVAAERAVALAKTPKEKGQAFYNAGRVEESDGKWQAAYDAYVKVPFGTPSETASIPRKSFIYGAGLTDESKPKLSPLSGPYASIEEACLAEKKEVWDAAARDEEPMARGVRWRCPVARRVVKAVPPFQEVVLYTSALAHREAGNARVAISIALRTSAG